MTSNSSLDNSSTKIPFYQIQNETIYFSLYSLTAIITDIGNTYILPSICVFGILSNFISIIVLYKMDLKNSMYKFMLIVSIKDFFYLFLPVFLTIFRCGALCPFGYKFGSKIYELYIYLFIGNTIMTFANMLDIFVSLNRLFAFSSSSPKASDISFKWRCIVSGVFALIINILVIILPKDIQKIGLLTTFDPTNSTHIIYDSLYSVKLSNIGKNQIGQLIVTILTFGRTSFLIFFLFIINLIVGLKFRKHIDKKIIIVNAKNLRKMNITKYTNKNNNITRMVLLMGCNYFAGNLPFGIAAILSSINFNPYIYSIYQLYSNSSLFISFGCNIFVYYFFDNSFKARLKRLIGKYQIQDMSSGS